VTASGPFSTLLRQRLPFLSLLGLAVCGTAISDHLHLNSALWVAMTVLSAGAFLVTGRAITFGFLVICAFGALHLWQGRESQSARFAAWLGSRELPADVRGVVTSAPRAFSGGRSSFEVRLSELRVEGLDLRPSFRILVELAGPAPAYGDEVSLRGMLGKIEPPRNPGQFDFAAWSARHCVFSRLEIAHKNELQILRSSQGNPLVSFSLRARAWLRQTLVEGVNDPTVSDLLVAMVLGDVSSLPEHIQEEFRGTGTFHLFSVSGLHVGMICILLWYGFKVLRVPRRHAAAWIVPLLFFYVLMTGLKAASVRSALMSAIVLMGMMANRRPILFNSLCGAGFLILLVDTNQLFNPGFQLSFSVVAAIILFAGPLSSAFAFPFRPDPFVPERLLSLRHRVLARAGTRFASLLAVSTAAWLSSLPLTLGYFHLVSITALPANMLAVPLSFAIMAVAMLSLSIGPFSIWMASIYNQTNWLLTKLLLGIVHAFASLPGSFFYVRMPENPAPVAEVLIFDFGSGGAAWVSAQGTDWLIDTGPSYSHDSVLLPFLRSRGLRSLDGFLITHGDAGHMGSAAELVRTCPPDRVVDSVLNDRSVSRGRLHAELSRLGIPKSLHRSGDCIVLGPEMRLHILYPPKDVVSPVSDDKALVVQLRAGPTRVLFMSDAGFHTEEWLLENVPDELPSDILIKGAPRRGPSGDSAFVNAVRPRAVIATAAPFPPTERIPPRFAEDLRNRGIRLFSQDRCGAVAIRIFTRHWEVSAFLDQQQYCHLR
jgi:ComEC/Rec2-related protein